ncbi:MAG: CheR family methyltransferase [Planctomycetota bacterium]|jgi:chemotaxis protein methyltransferase CheR
MSLNTKDKLTLIPISDGEFDMIRSLVYERLGINLTDKKRALVVGRLQKIVREKECKGFGEYYEYLLRDTTGQAISELADRISTNHTFFYRESSHFDFFLQWALPEVTTRMRERNNRDLRIWSAGCSTGEEPYTLVMLLMEHLGHEYPKWSAGVLATDVSERALSIAKRGIYAPENVEKMPAGWRQKYFRKLRDGNYAVASHVKKEVVFRRFNLINEVFPFKKPFHIVFCRNVMIYFDAPTREALVKRFHQASEAGAYLFVGHAESLRSHGSCYQYVKPAVYRRT